MKPFLIIGIDDVVVINIDAGDVAIVFAEDEDEAITRYCLEVAGAYDAIEAELKQAGGGAHYFKLLSDVDNDDFSVVKCGAHEFFEGHSEWEELYIEWAAAVWDSDDEDYFGLEIKFPNEMIGFMLLHTPDWAEFHVLDISKLPVLADNVTSFEQMIGALHTSKGTV